MQTLHRFLAAIGSAALLILTGCMSSGTVNRMQEKSAALTGLAPEVRQHIEKGLVEITYTPDMVYVALGKPSRIEHKTSADGSVEIWVYRNIVLPGNEGFRGLRYDSNFDITPSPITGIIHTDTSPRPDAQQGSKSSGSQGYGVNLDALSAATTLPDLPTGTLYIFFYDGHVFKMTLGG